MAERIDEHTATQATKTETVGGVVSEYVCICCYIIRIMAYGLIAGSFLTCILNYLFGVNYGV